MSLLLGESRQVRYNWWLARFTSGMCLGDESGRYGQRDQRQVAKAAVGRILLKSKVDRAALHTYSHRALGTDLCSRVKS